MSSIVLRDVIAYAPQFGFSTMWSPIPPVPHRIPCTANAPTSSSALVYTTQPHQAKDLVFKMLTVDLNKRATIASILGHPVRDPGHRRDSFNSPLSIAAVDDVCVC